MNNFLQYYQCNRMQNIEELVFSLKNKDIVVPEFQREYVWPHKKIKELFSSYILRGTNKGIDTDTL